MLLYILLYSALFVTMAYSDKENSTSKNQLENKFSSGNKLDLLSKTKLSLVSEGGAILPNISDISLLKQNITSLQSLDEELSNTKEKAVVARKGVDDLLADTDKDTKNASRINNAILQTSAKANTVTKKLSNISLESKDSNATTLLNKTLEEPKKLNNTLEKRKKPMILSSELIANMEKNMQSNKARISVAPSTKTIASSQIPSPNEDSIIKAYPSRANSHPGMIMPIVITILVVPMFAIVGYMALKRGQEAWKNRHYKRMDFLLDGMYND